MMVVLKLQNRPRPLFLSTSKYGTTENGYTRIWDTRPLAKQSKNFINLKIRDNKDIFELYSDIEFYDYTKDFKRSSPYDNYYILYSRSENTKNNVVTSLIEEGKNVAVVFDELPDTWLGIEVINGDLSDVRPVDKQGVIVGLKAKGLAKASKRTSAEDKGFVIETLNI